MPRFLSWIYVDEKETIKKISRYLLDFQSEEIKILFSLLSKSSSEDKYLCLSLLSANYLWLQLTTTERYECYFEAANLVSRNDKLSEEAKKLIRGLVVNNKDITLTELGNTSVNFFALMKDISSFPFPLNLKCITDILNADLKDPNDRWARLLHSSVINEEPLENMTTFFSIELKMLLKKTNEAYFSPKNPLFSELGIGYDISPELKVALSYSCYETNLSDIFDVLHVYLDERMKPGDIKSRASKEILNNFIRLMLPSISKEFYLDKLKESNKKPSQFSILGLTLFNRRLPGTEQYAKVHPLEIESPTKAVNHEI